MKTSAEWWRDVKQDEAELTRWLLSQYHGEVTAASRIERLRELFAVGQPRAYAILGVIAAQERLHAGWVLALLQRRGLDPQQVHEDRYWSRALPGISDLETGCAVGAHAEEMRLARIEVIAADPEAPAEIREVFQRILPQERFHARAFRGLSTPEALLQTMSAHEEGQRALGLVR